MNWGTYLIDIMQAVLILLLVYRIFSLEKRLSALFKSHKELAKALSDGFAPFRKKVD